MQITVPFILRTRVSLSTGRRLYKANICQVTTGLYGLLPDPSIIIDALYPNPAFLQVAVRYHLPLLMQGAELIVYNLYGQEVSRSLLSPLSETLILPVSGWREGIYYYRIETLTSAGYPRRSAIVKSDICRTGKIVPLIYLFGWILINYYGKYRQIFDKRSGSTTCGPAGISYEHQPRVGFKVINKMFGWKDDAERVKKLAYALSHPLKPVEIRRTRRRARNTSSRIRRT